MIFVTVGSDVPFDRLVKTVDAWAERTGRTDVFAQIGDTAWKPSAIRYTNFLTPAEFTQNLNAARCVVAHAGMGTILSALQAGVPIIALPRRGHLGETRNDHQYATARYLAAAQKITVAMDETELAAMLDGIDGTPVSAQIGSSASPELVTAIAHFIHYGGKP